MAADICSTALADVVQGGHYTINQSSAPTAAHQIHHHTTANMYKIGTTASHQPTATTTTYTIDITTACANCGVAFFDNAGNEIVQRIFYMAIDKTNEAILISSALQVVLAVKLAKCSEPLPKVALCAKCGEIVAQMYHLYKELDELSNVNSFINSFVINDLLLLRQPDETTGTAHYTHADISGIPQAAHSSGAASAGYNLSIPQQHYKTKEEPKQDPLAAAVGNYYLSTNQGFQYPEDALLLSEISSLPTQTSLPGHAHAVQQNALIKQENDAMMYSAAANIGAVQNTSNAAAPAAPPAKKAAKRKKKQPPPPPPPPPKEPEKPKRIIHCPEPGCNKTYTGAGARRSLRNHSKTVHNKPIEQESHTPTVIIPCSVCQRPLNSKAAVREHEKTHLGAEEKQILEQQAKQKEAQKANKSSANSHAAHSQAHTHSTPVHVQVHAPSSSITPIPSATSFTVTVTDPSPIAYSIATPLSHHTPAGPAVGGANGTAEEFSCSECGKRFTNKTSLNIHFNRQHKNPKSFSCTFEGCGKTFRDKSSVRRHELSHEFTSGTKPEDRRFSCKMCDKAFKLKHHLQSHLTFSHKYTPEEARAEVYPGLEVKDWMTKPRKKVVRKSKPGSAIGLDGSSSPSSADAVNDVINSFGMSSNSTIITPDTNSTVKMESLGNFTN